MKQQANNKNTSRDSTLISKLRVAFSLQPTPANTVKRPSSKKLTFYIGLTCLSVLTLSITIVSFFQNWPLTVFYLFGANSMTGAEKAGRVLRLPTLMFFGFLSAYLVKRCVETYRSSFDRQFEKALKHRDQPSRRKRPQNRIKK